MLEDLRALGAGEDEEARDILREAAEKDRVADIRNAKRAEAQQAGLARKAAKAAKRKAGAPFP